MLLFVAKTPPRLKSRYQEWVRAALDFSLSIDCLTVSLSFADMATRFSSDKYAWAKGKRDEPLSKISMLPAKKVKTRSNIGIVISSLVRTLVAPSPTASIEELPSPPWTCKGNEKKGEAVWTGPAMEIGRAYNVLSDDELKALSLVPSHELVSLHIHKLV